jgi:uncharacterized OB-fold protein
MPVQFRTGLPATGALQLQVCGNCGAVNYPSRELCGHCLADALRWQPVADGGVVQTLTELHYSLEPAYAAQLPWPVASVKLDCGPIAFAHLQPGLAVSSRVTVRILADDSGNNMLVAHAANDAATAAWLEKIQFNGGDV